MNEWLAKNIVYRFVQFARGEHVFNHYNVISYIPYLSHARIHELQLKKLRSVLTSAYVNIPFYRKMFDENGIHIDKLSLPDDMKALPILTKEDVRAHYQEIINPTVKKRVSKELSSGSSGNPLVIVKDRDKSGYARAVMYRCYAQYGINIGNKQARFWGVPVAPANFIKEKVKDLIANRIRLSAFNITDQTLHEFTKQMFRFKPKYFYGYPSMFYKYANWALENGYDFSELQLHAVINTGEILYDFQREAMEKAFGCKVVNEYGCSEIGVLAFECSEGNLHIMSDNVFLETVKSNNNRPDEIIVTELNNSLNPLIRYKLGDRGILSESKCTCGINLPIIGSLEGRDGSFIVTPEGKYVSDAILEYTFALGIKKFRATQDSVDELDISIVKRPDLNDALMKQYSHKLVKQLGTRLKINYTFVDDIEPEKSGKLRYFISSIEK